MHRIKAPDLAVELVKRKWQNKRRFVYKLLFLFFLIWYLGALPEKLFVDSTSTVLLDRNGLLLGARIADDGQWRFEESDSVPLKFQTCIVHFEDKDFYRHIGVSSKGIFRAVVQNVRSGKRKSGGSTITMQLVRLMRKNPPRTYSEKIREILLATRIEWSYSKDDILRLYASHAPFGNNVVGLEAASWRYFDRPSHKLSWSESAVLAVLPNAPGLIYPGKNHDRLLAKRNRLLRALFENGTIDKTTYELSLEEPLPEKPLPLPQWAPHLLDRSIKEGRKGKTIHSTVSLTVQKNAIRQLAVHSKGLEEKKIFNGAIVIADVKTGELLAYVGNTDRKEEEFSNWVDCASAPRSSGSILKPLLYSVSLEEGIISPDMLLSDVPSKFGSFSPKNFSGQFEGGVQASSALSRSLNIPMVHLLNKYGAKRFHSDLKELGLTTFKKPARHYGLSLILGGAEVRLDELVSVYMQLAQKLQKIETKKLHYSEDQNSSSHLAEKWSRGSIFRTFEAMQEVNRPDEDNNWQIFSSSRKISWKTGTSFGFRDAWSVGVTEDHVVAVWIGNADGEGRPGLTGVKAAAPLMFDLFRQLPHGNSGFKQPLNEMKPQILCRESGYMAGPNCKGQKTSMLSRTAKRIEQCPFHHQIHLDQSGKYRVDSDCENVFNMKKTSWFVLPSVMERYYKLNHPEYKVLPEFRDDCSSSSSERSIAFIYPKPNANIYVPIEIDGSLGRTIFEIAHRHGARKVYWHLDDHFVGETFDVHQVSLFPGEGKHRLTVVDETGVSQTISFSVAGKKSQ
jgi:penicillin-binding protein 1C